jgi:hypothetical protein
MSRKYCIDILNDLMEEKNISDNKSLNKKIKRLDIIEMLAGLLFFVSSIFLCLIKSEIIFLFFISFFLSIVVFLYCRINSAKNEKMLKPLECYSLDGEWLSDEAILVIAESPLIDIKYKELIAEKLNQDLYVSSDFIVDLDIKEREQDDIKNIECSPGFKKMMSFNVNNKEKQQ